MRDDDNNDETATSSSDDGGFVLELKPQIDAIITDIKNTITNLETAYDGWIEREHRMTEAIIGYQLLDEIRSEYHIQMDDRSEKLEEFELIAYRCDIITKQLQSLRIDGLDELKANIISINNMHPSKELLSYVQAVQSYLKTCVELTLQFGRPMKSLYLILIVDIQKMYDYYDIDFNTLKLYVTEHIMPAVEVEKLVSEEFLRAYEEFVKSSEDIDLTDINIDNTQVVSEPNEVEDIEKDADSYYEMCDAEMEL